MDDVADAGERADVAADSIAVMLPIPDAIARGWPDVGDNGEPHVTMVFVGPGSDVEFEQVTKIVAGELADILGQTARLDGIDHFDGDDKRVAFARVAVPAKVVAARDRIKSALESARIDVAHVSLDQRRADGTGPRDGSWIPHATLAYLDAGTDYAGIVPEGEWEIDRVQVWRGDQRVDVMPEVLAPVSDALVVEPFGAVVQRDLFAPAVHTESRTSIIEVMRSDRAELLPPEVLANKWRRYPILFSKAGNVQTYVLNGVEVREWRDPRAVFDRASMDSGIGVPWELRHSPKLLTPDTARGVARGCVLSVDQHTDGIHTAGNAVAWDRELFDAIAGPAPEISVANLVKIDRRPGTTDDGEKFDARQIRMIWNSIASEPKGNAGTARVLSDRFDSATITSGAAMLAFARSQVTPTSPVYFDQTSWVRFDSAHTPDPDTRKDNMNPKLIKILMSAAGVDAAALAEKLGVAEADLDALFAGELSDEQLAMLAEALVPKADAPPPADEMPPADVPPEDEMPREDMDMLPIMLGEVEYEVPAPVAALIESMKLAMAEVGSRADQLTIRLAASTTDVAKKTAALDGMVGMVPRKDADAMVAAAALDGGDAIELARRALGNDYTPTPRKDAAGEELPITIDDWKLAAITGAFGDDAPTQIARIDAAPDAARDYMLTDKLEDARKILDDRAHKHGDALDAIGRQRKDAADKRGGSGADADDKIAAGKRLQKQQAADYLGAPPQAQTTGA